MAESSHAAGGGWYRCSITLAAPPGFLVPCIFMRTANGQNGTYVGDGISGLYLWGAQLNRGSAPTVYLLPTTTAARFGLAVNHDPSTLAPRGLLV